MDNNLNTISRRSFVQKLSSARAAGVRPRALVGCGGRGTQPFGTDPVNVRRSMAPARKPEERRTQRERSAISWRRAPTERAPTG